MCAIGFITPSVNAPVTAVLTASVRRCLWRWCVRLVWYTEHATSAVLNGKSVPLHGSQTRTVSRGVYEYVLVATRGGEAISATVRVTAK